MILLIRVQEALRGRDGPFFSLEIGLFLRGQEVRLVFEGSLLGFSVKVALDFILFFQITDTALLIIGGIQAFGTQSWITTIEITWMERWRAGSGGSHSQFCFGSISNTHCWARWRISQVWRSGPYTDLPLIDSYPRHGLKFRTYFPENLGKYVRFFRILIELFT